MAKISAVIFDMDGTLINSEPLWHRAEIEGFAEIGVTLTTTDVLETVGVRLDQVVEYWRKKRPWSGASNKEVTDLVVEKLIALVVKEGEATAGSRAAIEYFHQRGVPLAIASASFEKIIKVVVEKLEIARFFQVIYSAEFEKLGKPDPAVYFTTAKKLELDPSRCLVFEDTLAGIKAAKAAGMTCVAVREHATPFERAKELADFALESFTDLPSAPWLNDLFTPL